MRGSRGSRVVIALAVVVLAGCAGAGASRTADEPHARVERIKGTDVRRVTFSARAVERLGIKTARVTATGAANETVVPYASLLYDPSGSTWVYVTATPRTYQRALVTVSRIVGQRVYLSAGPRVGSRVVSVGAAEVYGTEFFSNHE